MGQNWIIKLTCTTIFGYNETICNQLGTANATEEIHVSWGSCRPAAWLSGSMVFPEVFVIFYKLPLSATLLIRLCVERKVNHICFSDTSNHTISKCRDDYSDKPQQVRFFRMIQLESPSSAAVTFWESAMF